MVSITQDNKLVVCVWKKELNTCYDNLSFSLKWLTPGSLMVNVNKNMT